nr:inosine-uridine preferring nucleoside hydrolase-like [Syngnathus scovelli]
MKHRQVLLHFLTERLHYIEKPCLADTMKRLILDVDTGVDDAQAIMMALAAPHVEILGITCTHGNTPLQNALKNTLRVLKMCNRLDIKVYPGFDEPLLGNKIHAGDFHGKDGLGDAPDPDAPGLELVQKTNAVEAIISISNQNPGQVTRVFQYGNVRGLFEPFAIYIAHLDVSHNELLCFVAHAARGNTTVCGEFNFLADPEAVFIVLERYTCPTTIASWEFSCRNSLPWSFCDSWLAQNTPKARFMETIYAHTRKMVQTDRYQKELVSGSGFNTCDTYAVAVAISDNLVTESEEVPVTVELEGKNTRGMMVLDYLDVLHKEHKVTILKKIDVEVFKQLLMNALK